MARTYIETFSELNQRGFDALNVAHSMQVALLRVTREFTQTVSSPAHVFGMPPMLSAMTELTAAFSFQLLEQQVAHAKELANLLTELPKQALGPESTNALVIPAASSLALSSPTEAVLALAPHAASTLTLVYSVEDVAASAVDINEAINVEPSATHNDATQAAALSSASERLSPTASAPDIEVPSKTFVRKSTPADSERTPSTDLPAAADGKKPTIPSVSNNRSKPKRRGR